MASSDIFVRPMGWEQAPASERFTLSPIAHTMPKIYVLMAEVFRVPADQLLAPETIVNNMTMGLKFTLSQFPALASTLQMDEASGRMWAAKTRNSGVHFHVKHMTSEVFPSYHDLEKKDVRISDISGPRSNFDTDVLVSRVIVGRKQDSSHIGDSKTAAFPRRKQRYGWHPAGRSPAQFY